MKLFKKVLTATAFAAAVVSSNAATINVGGVVWNPDAANDFTAQFNFAQQFLGNPLVVGTALQGFGEFEFVFEGGEESVSFHGFLDQRQVKIGAA